VLGLTEIALNLAKQLSANQLAAAELATIPVVGPVLSKAAFPCFTAVGPQALELKAASRC
jgi:hypothetical protein